MRDKVQDIQALIDGNLKLCRVHITRRDTFRFNRRPSVIARVFIFLEDILTPLTTVEISHRGIVLLKLFKKMQDRVAIRWEVHFGIQVHIDVKIIAVGTKM